MPTPHNNASLGDFAQTVLMPGDPLRSKFIAENYLDNPICVNNVRGIQGYTGTYRGKKLSVMASGMGAPSMSIYSHELFNFYGVENIIRVGSIGSLSENAKLRDIIIADQAFSEIDFSKYYPNITEDSYKSSPVLLSKAISSAHERGLSFVVGPVFSSEFFYGPPELIRNYSDKGAIGVEMETSALYCNAFLAGKNALTVCTVSDNLITGEKLSTDERATSFREMFELALDIA